MSVTPEVPVLAETVEQGFARQVDETKGYLERLAAPLRDAGFNVRTEVSLDEHANRAQSSNSRGTLSRPLSPSRAARDLSTAERLFGSVTTRVIESNVAPIMLVPQTP